MTDAGVVKPTESMAADTGNRLFSYISLVDRMNTHKKRVKSSSRSK